MYLHKWWARRLGSVFRTILLYALVDQKTRVKEDAGSWRAIAQEELANPWLLFAQDVDLREKIVVDPFMGAGVTVIKGLNLNCRLIAQDLNPVAWFLVKVALEPLQEQLLQAAMQQLKASVAGQIARYYTTLCPSCLEAWARGRKKTPAQVVQDLSARVQVIDSLADCYKEGLFAESIYYFWIKTLVCEKCGGTVPLFKGFMFAHQRKGRVTTGYYLLCPACGEIFVHPRQDGSVTCPTCHVRFNPQKGPVDRRGTYYTCPNPKCQHHGSILDTVRRAGKPSEKLYAVQMYCPQCNAKKFARATPFDRALFDRATRELKTASDSWINCYIPGTEVPPGFNTKQATNYGYRHWRDMFNPRQLLALGTLFRGICVLNCPESIRDFLLLTFSKSLEYSNMLCEYHRVNNYVYNLFKTHAFHPPLTPCESHPWGARFGFGTFQNLFEANVGYKRFNRSPYVKYIHANGKVTKFPSSLPVIGRVGNLEDPAANVLLLNGDSSHLPVPDKVADAVITDPPYFDNVMYSELSEFYYTWLRLALAGRYPAFQPDHVTNRAEVIVNRGHGKDESHYVQGLTRVFAEAVRVLKDEGMFVFTFHHQEDKAWGAILQSVLDAGLYITATHPVWAEMITAVPILGKANPQCDVIVACRKSTHSPPECQWEDLERQVRAAIDLNLQKFNGGGYAPSAEDLLVMATGKGLEVYSRHYPNVFENRERVSIPLAISKMRAFAGNNIKY